MSEYSIDSISQPEIMNVEETSQYLRKSTSWVYKNWKILGGRKLRGSLLFPAKEDLYERLFCKRQGQGVALRLHPEGNQTHQGLVQTKTGRPKIGDIKKGGNTKSGTDDRDAGEANRHGILGSG